MELRHAMLVISTVALSTTLAGVEVDPTFTAQVRGTIHAIALMPDGAIMAGGEFEAVNGVARANLVRLTASGEVDASFNGNFDDAVFALAQTADGSLYCGGAFNSPSRHIARLTPGGALDPKLALGTSTSSRVNCLAVFPEGGAIFGGPFRRVNGEQCHYAGKVSAEGLIDANFASALLPSLALEAGATAVAVQPDGKVVLGGNVETVDGFAYLVRLKADGSLDGSFSGEHGPILYPKAILMLPDGKILVGGVASPAGEGFVRRLNPDGSVDASFSEALFDGSVEAIALESNGNMIVGGNFNGKIARLSAEGGFDSGWDIACDGPVKAIVISPEGNVLIGGAFTTVGEIEHRGIARLRLTKAGHEVLSATNVNGRFSARLRAEVGKTYAIETSADLRAWTSIGSAVGSTSGVEICDAAAHFRKHRFFRLRTTN